MFLAVVEVQAGDCTGNPVYVGCFPSRRGIGLNRQPASHQEYPRQPDSARDPCCRGYLRRCHRDSELRIAYALDSVLTFYEGHPRARLLKPDGTNRREPRPL